MGKFVGGGVGGIGESVGNGVGLAVGESVGNGVGLAVGESVGAGVGASVGTAVVTAVSQVPVPSLTKQATGCCPGQQSASVVHPC